MQITYSAFSSQPTPAQLDTYPGAALWYLLDGDLLITEHGRTFWQEDFPLFRLAALLHHWLAYRPAPLDESRLVVEDFRDEPALVIRRQAPDVTLTWTEEGRAVSSVAVIEAEFTRASQAFLQQLQTDVQVRFGVDMHPLLRGIPF
ncbi:hypothetical protein LJ737_24135 [Hymenobacter sp. 15J16-1T3B]|uniref:hypothetical protein n=1 Tax=Hymenobacter sp. 15J16-1T3B TaxID=2886941 RepID=UPI001D11E214|nr:hypothetical protein [Hymenobacter sp. 15J16-1T3B]MCC3160347.1 hypothetical protein [Hymenobacter sp. 15J16-1T3B]